MNLKAVTAALKAYHEATQNNVVPEAIILHRATICKQCPQRKLARGSTGHASRVLGILSGKHGVPNEISAFACGVCGCSMLLLLPAQEEHLHKDSSEEAAKRPDTCWIKKKN